MKKLISNLTLFLFLFFTINVFANNWGQNDPEPELPTQTTDVDNTNVNANANKNTAVGIGYSEGGTAHQKNYTTDVNKVDTDVNTTDLNFNKVNTDVNTTDVNFVEGSESSSNSHVGSSGNSSNSNSVGDSKSTSAIGLSGNSSNVVDGGDISIAGDTVAGSTQTQQSASDSSADNSGNNTGNADVNVDASDHSITQYEAAKIPVAQAATTFASICTSGASNQKNTYGISIAVSSIVCEKMMLADAYMALGMVEEAKSEINAARRHARFKGFFRYPAHMILGIF